MDEHTTACWVMSLTHQWCAHATALCTGEAASASHFTHSAGQEMVGPGLSLKLRSQRWLRPQCLLISYQEGLCYRDKTLRDSGGTPAPRVHVMEEAGVHSSPEQTLPRKEF